MTCFQAIGRAWNTIFKSPAAFWIPLLNAILFFAVVMVLVLSGMGSVLSLPHARSAIAQGVQTVSALVFAIAIFGAGPFCLAATYGSFADVARGFFRPSHFWANGAKHYGQGWRTVISLVLTPIVCGLASVLIGLIFAHMPILRIPVYIAVGLAWVVIYQAIVMLGPVVFLVNRGFLGDIGTAFRIAWRHWWTLLGIGFWTALISVAAAVIGSLFVLIPVLGWLIYAMLVSGAWVLTTMCYWVYCNDQNPGSAATSASDIL